MAKKTEQAAAAPETILIGPCQIARAWAEQFGPGSVSEYTQAGVVLFNERQKHTIKIGDTPVALTVSLYITRDPVGQEEANAVAEVKQTRTADKKKKELDAANALAAEKRTMFELGKQSSAEAVFSTLGQVDKLIAVGQLVNKLTGGSALPKADS